MRPGAALFLVAAAGRRLRPSGAAGRKRDTRAPIPKPQRRARMVETQIVSRGVRDPRVLAAMREVPRHLFVDPSERARAYDDTPLPIAGNQTISQPYIVALMTELLDLQLRTRGCSRSAPAPATRAPCSRRVAPRGLLDRDRAGARAVVGGAPLRARLRERHGPGGRRLPRLAGARPVRRRHRDGRARSASRSRCSTSSRPAAAWSFPVGGFFQELKVFRKDAAGKVTEQAILPVRFVPMTGEVEKTPRSRTDRSPENRRLATDFQGVHVPRLSPAVGGSLHLERRHLDAGGRAELADPDDDGLGLPARPRRLPRRRAVSRSSRSSAASSPTGSTGAGSCSARSSSSCRARLCSRSSSSRARVQVWIILTLSFVVGLAQSFGGPAYQALVPTLVDREDLPNAVALNSIQFNLARVIGPVLGGHRVLPPRRRGLLRLERALLPRARSRRCCFLKRGGGPSPPTGAGAREPEDGAARRARRSGRCAGLVGLAFVGSFCALPLVTFLPVFARDVFHRDAKGYSVLLAAFGVGAIAGAIGVAGFGHVQRKGILAVVDADDLRRPDGGLRAVADAVAVLRAARPGGRLAHGRLRAVHDARPGQRGRPAAGARRVGLLVRLSRRHAAREPGRRISGEPLLGRRPSSSATAS